MAGERKEQGQGDIGRPAADRPAVDRERQEFEAAPPDSGGELGSETRPEDVQAREPGTRRGPPPDLHRQTVDESPNRPIWGWVIVAVALVLALAWIFLLPG